MDGTLQLIAFVMIFFLFFAIIYDINRVEYIKEEIKDALDISTKAATLQIDKNPELISEGIFRIDNLAAKAVFIDYMTDNLKTSNVGVIPHLLYYDSINDPVEFIHPITGKVYHIGKPSFIAIMTFRYDGIFLKEDVMLDNLSASQLYSIH